MANFMGILRYWSQEKGVPLGPRCYNCSLCYLASSAKRLADAIIFSPH